jgi:CRISPR-associated protein Cmr6
LENLNLLFYKTFYSKLGDNTRFDERNKVTVFEHDIITKSKILVGSRFYKEDYKPVCEAVAPHKFMLKTAYPGLLIGTGYAHGVDSDNDIKVGFSFDYVTGQPYIPGSSVKGLLRSYFKHTEVIEELLGVDEIDVKALEESIFGTQDEASDDGVDIFFDAVIRHGGKDGRVMGYDAITPHGKDLTKNPTPIKILKVLPEVVFEFSFKLQDSDIGDKKVTKEQKNELFKEILCCFGIGAKTNVGYGVLLPYSDEEYKSYTYPKPEDMTTAKPSQIYQRKSESSSVTSGSADFETNKVYEAVVTGGNDKKIFIKIQGKNCKCFIWKDRVKSEVTKGVKIKASFFKADNYGNYCFNYVGKL